jgi:hypothetical protein
MHYAQTVHFYPYLNLLYALLFFFFFFFFFITYTHTYIHISIYGTKTTWSERHVHLSDMYEHSHPYIIKA